MRCAAVLLAVLTTLQAITGCAWLVPAAVAEHPVSPDVTAAVRAVLEVRSRAVRQHQPRRFLRTVEPGATRAAQRVWFENLRQLPLQEFSQRLEGALTWEEGRYRGVVRTSTRIRDFDAVAVPSFTEIAFVASDHGWLVASERPVSTAHTGVRQPWDTSATTILRRGRVLVVADGASASRSSGVADSTAAAISRVRATIPWSWPDAVLVQAPSTTVALEQTGNLPGSDAERLDGLTYRVRGGRDGQRFAASRLVLHPRMLRASERSRARLLRHELTHVALGERNDRIPMWLSEGVAEYVATRDLPLAERTIDRSARAAAAAGSLALPTDRGFRATATPAQYAMSWYACEVIVREHGDAVLWRLVERMAGRGTASPNSVLRDVLRLDEEGLGRRAQHLIRVTYR